MVTIIDYGMGNLGSVANMIRKIGHKSVITSEIDIIKKSKKIILPGVGHFGRAMNNIRKSGLDEILRFKTLEERTPILGICLGMQILCLDSEEGGVKGLGLIDANVMKFKFNEKSELKIPHMGWNLTHKITRNLLFDHLDGDTRFYFVHSYHAVCNNINDVIAFTNYGYEFVSSFAHQNIMGVQFHPEKSHKFGMQLLKNFIEKF